MIFAGCKVNFVLAIDYDDTLFLGGWDVPGTPNHPVLAQAKRFCEHPCCEVILWTCREERLLVAAIDKCEEYGLRFDAVNMNTREALQWNVKQFGRHGPAIGRKVYADLYVDDKSPGSIEHFLSLDPNVEWNKVRSRKID